MIGLSPYRNYLPFTAIIATIIMGILGGKLSAAFFLLSQIVPLFLVVSLVLKKEKETWFPATKIITILTASSLLLMTLFFLWLLVIKKAPLEVETSLWLKRVIKEENLPDKFNTALSMILPSLMGVSWISATAINAFVGQKFLHFMGESLRPFPAANDFAPVYTWDWILVFFVGMATTLMKPIYPTLAAWGVNAMLLAALPLFMLGLRIFYLGLMRWKIAKFWFFVSLLFMFILVWPLLLIVSLGVLEPLLKLYSRLDK